MYTVDNGLVGLLVEAFILDRGSLSGFSALIVMCSLYLYPRVLSELSGGPGIFFV